MLIESAGVGIAGPDVDTATITHTLEALLPMSLVRGHLKLDDMQGTSNEQLELYRQAAVEAAVAYTGLTFGSSQYVTERIKPPPFKSFRQKPTFRHTARYPFAHDVGYFYGVDNMPPQRVWLQVGSTVADLPVLMQDFGLNCCNPCKADLGARFMYRTGYTCPSHIPAAFRLGCLKYIAHVVENPGDLVQAFVANGKSTTGLNATEGSNPATASGALEIWRVLVRGAI